MAAERERGKKKGVTKLTQGRNMEFRYKCKLRLKCKDIFKKIIKI